VSKHTTDIKYMKPGDRLFIRNHASKRPRLVTVESVDYKADSFVTIDGETISDMSVVEGWDLAGNLFNVPKDR
jgi:hypothetical protein